MASLHREPARDLAIQLRLVKSAGVALPADLEQVRTRLDDFTRTAGDTIATRLIDAITSGADPATRDDLWAEYVAVSNGSHTELLDGIKNKVSQRILEDYRTQCGATNYAAVAATFNKTAATFTDCYRTVDIEADPESLLDADAKVRKSWQTAALMAAELNRLITPLKAAAELAGARNIDVVALCVDTDGCDRHAIREAWDTDERERIAKSKVAHGSGFTITVTTTRCGRWTNLLRADARIRAAELHELI